MSLYRKVEMQTWGDKKFRALSPLAPSGQALWLYLLTGPQTGILPGLLRAGRAAMAEELGWSLEAFDEAFGEAFREGMVQADWKARLVWLPKALRATNKPESPNVAIAWRKAFDRLPDCDLKATAEDAICMFLAGVGPEYLAAFTGDRLPRAPVTESLREAFTEAFDKAFRKAFPKPSPKGSPKTMPNQETGNRRSNNTHTRARARGDPESRRGVRRRPQGSPPLGLRVDQGAFNVPQGLHDEFAGKLVHSGMSVDAATKSCSRGIARPKPHGRGSRWTAGTTTTSGAPAGVNAGRPAPRPRRSRGWPGAAWRRPAPVRTGRCPHEWPHCLHRAACELVTARDVREGRLALEPACNPPCAKRSRAMVDESGGARVRRRGRAAAARAVRHGGAGCVRARAGAPGAPTPGSS